MFGEEKNRFRSAACADSYLSELQHALDNSGRDFLRAGEIDDVVRSVNRGGNEQEKRLRAVRAVNVALAGGDADATADALSDPALGLSVHRFAGWLYHGELGYVRDGSGAGT